MTQVISIDTSTAKNILDTLNELKKEVARLRKKFEEEPRHGSREWWEWSEKRADEDIKGGKVVKFDSVSNAVKWLNS